LGTGEGTTRTIVCMKVVPRTEEIRLDQATKTVDRSQAESEINQPDKNALEMALQLREKHGGEVILLSMGPPFFERYLRLGMACGADSAFLLSDSAFAGADTCPTSFTLAAAIRKIGGFDLILCGEESSDASTGQVPPGIAEWLDVPQVTYVKQLNIDGNVARARRTISGGYEIIETSLPLLASVELGCNSPRFPDFRRKKSAEDESKLTVWSAADLGADSDKIGRNGSHTVVERLEELPKLTRKMQLITGSPREEALQIIQKMQKALAG
jgi:electron transfer flavoprotein beta subunit